MGFLSDWLNEWIKEILVDGIMSNLSALFDDVNAQVGEIAANVGQTPWAFNPDVFALVRNLSETVVLPIAGIVLTFVMTWELIHLIIDRNNLHEIDAWIFFKWIFKTTLAVLVLSNTFDIVMGIFDLSRQVVNNASGLISGETAVTPALLATFENELTLMDNGALLGLWLQSIVIKIIVVAMNICVFIIIYGRMIEIFIMTSLAPLPLATLTSHEMGSVGQNYLRALLAVGFQGLLIMVCVGIYATLARSIAVNGDPIGAVWACVGYTALLCFALFKTGSVSKSVFGTSG